MTTKHLDGYYPGGYTLSARYSKLVIDKTADVRGSGVTAPYFATVVNRGAIYGSTQGVYLEGGGSLINGSEAEADASISGVTAKGVTTITNFGTIYGAAHSGAGVILKAGGSIENGSAGDSAALITGAFGVYASGAAATVANFGTIHAGADYSPGVRLLVGGSLTNGSTSDSSALIYGQYGVEAAGAATVVNFGTIEGTIGVSVELYGAGSEVVAEAGSTFIGKMGGGGGRLALAGGGTGTISNLGGGGTLTGAVDADFSGFGSYEIAAGGTWTLSGSNRLNAASVLIDEGTLINRGALKISGTISIEASAQLKLASGNVSAGPTGAASIVDDGLLISSPGTGEITVGAHVSDLGVVEVAAGTLDFTSHLLGTGVLKIDRRATLEVDAAAVSTLTVSFNGPAATLALKTPKAFDATLSGLAAGDVIDLLAIKATGASVNGDDQLVIVNGARTVASLQLSGNYIGATFKTASDGHGGTNVELISGGGAEVPSVPRMAAAMASLVASAGAAVPSHSFPAGCAPTLANPHVHLQ